MMPEQNHCLYFVKRKKRYCRMTVKKGNKYCGEHQESALRTPEAVEDVIKFKRVKCPLDPTQ